MMGSTILNVYLLTMNVTFFAMLLMFSIAFQFI